MNFNPFRSRLTGETKRWQDEGIITADQRNRILALYPEPSSPKPSVGSRLPAIARLIAVILISMGLALFYAVNWPQWDRTVKISQIFAFLFLFHGAGLYVLYRRGHDNVYGRVFFLLGSVTFGIGLMLLAQIYHISPRPAMGALVWAIAALITGLALKDHWQYWLAGLLFYIWNFWSVFDGQSYNLAYPMVCAILIYLFAQSDSRWGVRGAVFSLFSWFYFAFVLAMELQDYGPGDDGITALFLFIAAHLPLGALLFALPKVFPNLEQALNLKRFGFLTITGALFVLSFPRNFGYQSFLDAEIPPYVWLTAGALTILAVASYLYLAFAQSGRSFNQRQLLTTSGPVAVFLIALSIPVLDAVIYALYFNLLFILFMYGLLEFSDELPSHSEKFTRALFIIYSILYSMAFIYHSAQYPDFARIIFMGLVVFLNILFLINTFHGLRCQARQRSYSVRPIQITLGFLAYFALYILSFEMKEQKSVYDTLPQARYLLVLFFLISAGLYYQLLASLQERLTVILSAIVFGSVIFTLLFGIYSWVFYSIVFSLLLLVYIGVLLAYSLKINSTGLANAATAGFMLLAVTRYFDVLRDLMESSLFYIATGFFVLGLGWFLDRNRRRLLAQIEENSADKQEVV